MAGRLIRLTGLLLLAACTHPSPPREEAEPEAPPKEALVFEWDGEELRPQLFSSSAELEEHLNRVAMRLEPADIFLPLGPEGQQLRLLRFLRQEPEGSPYRQLFFSAPVFYRTGAGEEPGWPQLMQEEGKTLQWTDYQGPVSDFQAQAWLAYHNSCTDGRIFVVLCTLRLEAPSAPQLYAALTLRLEEEPMVW